MPDLPPAIIPVELRQFPPVAPLAGLKAIEDHRLRQTFLAKESECPRSAYLYEKYRGGAATHPLARGTLLHRATERFLRHLVENDEPSGPPELGKDILNDVIRESTDLVVPPGEQDSLRAMMHNFAEGTYIQPQNVIAIEDPIEIEVGEWTVTGRIDYAEWIPPAAIIVRDWKSAFLPFRSESDEDRYGLETPHMPSKEEWAGTFQVILYALGLAIGKLRGEPFPTEQIETFVLEQVHPRHFWASQGTMGYRRTEISRVELLDWRIYLETLVAQTAERFQTWDFPAVHGAHCDYCPCSAECPIPAAVRDYRGEVRTYEDAVRAMEIRFAAKRRSAKMLAAAKGWSKANGGEPIRYGRDQIAEWQDQETTRLRSKVAIPEGGVVSGRDHLRMDVERAVEYGMPFEWDEHFRPSVTTKLQERSLTERELAAEKEAQDGRSDPS